MAKASLTLPDGTAVTIEGTPDEVHRLLQLNTGVASSPGKGTGNKRRAVSRPKSASPSRNEDVVDLAAIVNDVKTCDEADAIEKHILDRTSQVDRILLPLYINQEHLGSNQGLTSGEISKVTRDLGIPIAGPNASNTLSGAASKYVMGHTVRKKGLAVRYLLSRRGKRYLEQVIGGRDDEK